MDDKLTHATQEFIKRRARLSDPDGKFDKGQRWYPSDTESQACCGKIRPPSRSFPYSLLVHCRTAAHVAVLYGVKASDIRRETRTEVQPRRLGGTYYKRVAVVDGKYLSIYDGNTEYILGQTLTQKVGKGHNGGFYVYNTPEQASKASVPTDSVLTGEPTAVLEIEATGQYTRYPAYDCYCETRDCSHTKYAFSTITPMAVVA